jgi:hypothetical protein
MGGESVFPTHEIFNFIHDETLPDYRDKHCPRRLDFCDVRPQWFEVGVVQRHLADVRLAHEVNRFFQVLQRSFPISQLALVAG